MIEHGHLDPEANPSYESNVTIHAHENGERSHRHPDAPSWGAIGDVYLTPERAATITALDREGVQDELLPEDSTEIEVVDESRRGVWLTEEQKRQPSPPSMADIDEILRRKP